MKGQDDNGRIRRLKLFMAIPGGNSLAGNSIKFQLGQSNFGPSDLKRTNVVTSPSGSIVTLPQMRSFITFHDEMISFHLVSAGNNFLNEGTLLGKIRR